jgi:hypothetical protein
MMLFALSMELNSAHSDEAMSATSSTRSDESG